MASDTDVILEIFGKSSQVQLIVGNYRGLDGLRVLVDFDDGRVPAHPAIAYRPEINESVWVAVINGVAYMLGPTVAKPADGTIVSVASNIATVSTDIGNVTATYNSGLTLTAGNQVKLMWGNGCHVVGIKSTTPPPPEVPPAPAGGRSRTTQTFTAIDSGSYQASGGYGWRTNEVFCSASNKGLWFYGSKIRDTIPDTATILAAEIYLPPPSKLVGAIAFGRHGYDTKPGGEPTVTDTAGLSGTSGWVSIPTAHINHLKANPGGLGFGYGGWNIWPGTQADGQSGAVRVTYET